MFTLFVFACKKAHHYVDVVYFAGTSCPLTTDDKSIVFEIIKRVFKRKAYLGLN